MPYHRYSIVHFFDEISGNRTKSSRIASFSDEKTASWNEQQQCDDKSKKKKKKKKRIIVTCI